MKNFSFWFFIALSKAFELPQGVIQDLSPEKLESYGFKKYYNETFANNFVIIRVFNLPAVLVFYSLIKPQ